MATSLNTNYAPSQQDIIRLQQKEWQRQQQEALDRLYGQQEQPTTRQVTTQSDSIFKLSSSQKLAIKMATNVLVVLAIIFVVMLIVRAFWLWYWKVNRIVNLLEDIEKNTRAEKDRT